jgi:hypothetical protein
MADGKIEVDATPVPEGGEAMLRDGLTLVKIENETQMTMAVQRPRDEALILKAALDELSLYPEMAEDAVYRKPVGKEQVAPGKWEMKYAMGLSIRAAEALAYRWKNNGFGAEILSDDGEIVSGVAVWVDYESNNRRTFPFRVSRKYKTKGGGMAIHKEDRFHDLVVPARQSKALREVILRSLPPGLKCEYERKALEIRSKQKPTERWAKMLRKFGPLGVSQDDLEKMMEKEAKAFTAEDFDTILGVYNAIMDGDTTVSQAFGKETADAAAGGKGTISVDEILGKGGKMEEGKKPGEGPAGGTPDDTKRADLWEKIVKLAAGDLEKADLIFLEVMGAIGSQAKDLKSLRGKNLDKAAVEVLRRMTVAKEEESNG